MKQSTNALAGLSAILLCIGLLVGSPSAGFLLMGIAAICALLPLAFGAKAARVAGLVLFIAASVLAVKYYPDFRSEQRAYTARHVAHP